MSLLSPVEVREIITGISKNETVACHCENMKTPFEPEDVQAFFETMYLGRFRTGELCGVKCPSDKNKNTGHTLKASQTIYIPDESNNDEIDNLTRLLYAQNIRAGKKEPPTFEDILSIKEPILMLQVQVEKRKDLFVRHTAVPLRPEIEPLAKRVLEYISKKQSQDQLIFPINRMQALRLAHKIFAGKEYQIRAYRKNLVNPLTGETLKKKNDKGELKTERVTVPKKLKPFGDHAVRHAGTEELKKRGVRGHRLTAFLGWSPKAEDVLEEVYDQNDSFAACRLYLPFLITKRL